MQPLEMIKFDAQGLVPAIAQDYQTGEVLMVAYMNAESLQLTLDTGIMHYWSRSRNKLWKKGESSGHLQEVMGLYVDCDADCVLATVNQHGAACHDGYRSCFYRKWEAASGQWRVTGDRVVDPEQVYGAKS